MNKNHWIVKKETKICILRSTYFVIYFKNKHKNSTNYNSIKWSMTTKNQSSSIHCIPKCYRFNSFNWKNRFSNRLNWYQLYFCWYFLLLSFYWRYYFIFLFLNRTMDDKDGKKSIFRNKMGLHLCCEINSHLASIRQYLKWKKNTTKQHR